MPGGFREEFPNKDAITPRSISSAAALSLSLKSSSWYSTDLYGYKNATGDDPVCPLHHPIYGEPGAGDDFAEWIRTNLVSRGWEEVEATVDSGAVKTVGSTEQCTGYRMEPTAASKAGRNFIGANEAAIKN